MHSFLLSLSVLAPSGWGWGGNVKQKKKEDCSKKQVALSSPTSEIILMAMFGSWYWLLEVQVCEESPVVRTAG
jgi:hypothetical protein